MDYEYANFKASGEGDAAAVGRQVTLIRDER
jgi:hypothetical protein